MRTRFGGEYVLVEANPALAASLHSHFRAINCAVAKLSGTTTLHIARDDEWSSILPLPAQRSIDGVQVGQVDVPACTLDDLLAELPGDCVDVVKLDVEGAEMAVLDALSERALARIRQITVEFHSAPEFGFGIAEDVERLLVRLRHRGLLALEFSHGERTDVLLINRGLHSRAAVGRARAAFAARQLRKTVKLRTRLRRLMGSR
jgi:FkbM family methyltransferase